MKQLVPLSSPQIAQHDTALYPYGHDVQQTSQSRQPFLPVIGPVSGSDAQSDVQQPFCFRQVTVKNNGPNDVHVIDVRFSQKLPLWRNTMALIDDAGISARATDKSLETRFESLTVSAEPSDRENDNGDQQQRQRWKKKNKARQQQQQQQQQRASPDKAESNSLPRAQPQDKPQDGVQGVLLHAGEEFPVAVVLNCVDGPYRK